MTNSNSNISYHHHHYHHYHIIHTLLWAQFFFTQVTPLTKYPWSVTNCLVSFCLRVVVLFFISCWSNSSIIEKELYFLIDDWYYLFSLFAFYMHTILKKTVFFCTCRVKKQKQEKCSLLMKKKLLNSRTRFLCLIKMGMGWSHWKNSQL